MRRLDRAILGLAATPRPHGSAKIHGEERQYRIRAGAYRIVYEVYDEALVVVVVRIGHRREVYR